MIQVILAPKLLHNQYFVVHRLHIMDQANLTTNALTIEPMNDNLIQLLRASPIDVRHKGPVMPNIWA